MTESKCFFDFFDTCSRYRVSIFNDPPEELAAELERDLDVLRSYNQA